MQTRNFAFFSGVVMLSMGVLALLPFLSQVSYLPALRLDASCGFFLGLFPMNILNKLALMIFGAAGIAASQSLTVALPRSILYSRTVGVAFGALAILGIIPLTSTLFGYWPLFGGEVVVHALLSGMGIYYGFVLPRKRAKQGMLERQRSESIRRVA